MRGELKNKDITDKDRNKFYTYKKKLWNRCWTLKKQTFLRLYVQGVLKKIIFSKLTPTHSTTVWRRPIHSRQKSEIDQCTVAPIAAQCVGEGQVAKCWKFMGKKTNIFSWPPSIIQIAPGTKVFLQMMSRHVRRFFELKTIIILLTFFIYLSSFWSRGTGWVVKKIFIYFLFIFIWR